MNRHFLFPTFALVFIILQVTLLDALSSGIIRIELSLVLVIYCGFNLDFFKGGLPVVIMGVCLDALVSNIPFFYTSFYLIVFLAAKVASFRVYGEEFFFIMAFAFVCSLFQWVLITLLYWYSTGIIPPIESAGPVLLQALLIACLVQPLFAVFRICEEVLHAEQEQ
ncbi:MAG: hypothetical protein PHU03_01800 [Syntrophales bacterium]|nr:hypothetical protein [Syntrophales bacterium]